MESIGGNLKGINEGEEVDAKEKYGMFRNNAARNVLSEHMRLMTVEKRDEDAENSSGGEEIEITIHCLARLENGLCLLYIVHPKP